jgi:hypothetical protein
MCVIRRSAAAADGSEVGIAESSMITDTKMKSGTDAITSDQWHVVHSRFIGKGRRLPFSRLIHSEHTDRATCVVAARALRAKLRAEADSIPPAERDEVFVRQPGYKSLKIAKRRIPRRPQE